MRIPDSEITYAAENSMASYYRVGQHVHVRVARNSKNALVFFCLTDHKTDCAHAKAVQRLCTPRSREEAA